MAIAKIEKRSATVWRGPSAVTAGIGVGLIVISLLFFWLAVKSFMVRTGYVDAAFKYDSNRRQEVRGAAERARSWGNHAESSELLAKVLVEQNQLDAAEKIYGEMVDGPRRAFALIGQGVILLRRADAEKESKKAAEFTRRAKDKFGDAKSADSSLLESQIGAATSDLILGVKIGDASKIAAARGEFLKILKTVQASEDAAAKVTRQGYTDLFVGLARSHASTEKFSPEALSFAGSARRYVPTSNSLYAMELALQAQQMVESPLNPADIKTNKLQEKLNLLMQKLITSTNPKEYEEVSRGWFALTLATAAALARQNEAQQAKDMLNTAQRAKNRQDLAMAAALEAALAMEIVTVPEQNWNKRQTNYQGAHALMRKVNENADMQAALPPHLRAALLNNYAFIDEDFAAQGGGESRYQPAVASLLKALEAEKEAGMPDGSYEVRRNLAVIQKRRQKPDAAEHFAAAQRLASERGDEAVRKDLEELQKYFAQ
jgi:hypothetical protein